MLSLSDVGISRARTTLFRGIFGRSCIFEVLFPTHDAVLPGISERCNQPTDLFAEDAWVPELGLSNS